MVTEKLQAGLGVLESVKIYITSLWLCFFFLNFYFSRQETVLAIQELAL